MKKTRILALLLALLLLLSACAKPTAKQPEATQPEMETPVQTEEQPEAPDEEEQETPETAEEAEEPTGEETPAEEPSEEEPVEEAPKVEEPYVEPFAASWLDKTEKTDDTVVVDADGIVIVLTAQTDVKAVRISTVREDQEEPDYLPDETLYETDEMKPDERLELQIRIPDGKPQLMVSWEDEFGQRSNRLILPQKLYINGKASQEVRLLYHRAPIQPKAIITTQSVPPVESEVMEAEPYTAADDGMILDKTQLAAQYAFDLDGNGRRNDIQLLRLVDKDGNIAFAPRVICGSATYDLPVVLRGLVTLYLADLDGDMNAELYFSGDRASDDNETYGWKLEDNEFVPVDFLGDIRSGEFDRPRNYINGRIVEIQGNRLTLESYTHMLGSFFVTQDYTPEADGTLSPYPGRNWVCKDGPSLTVKKALPVVIQNHADILAPGTVLTVTGVNCQTVDFKTADGATGYVTLEENSDEANSCVWRIAGLPDTDYFELLPYAG